MTFKKNGSPTSHGENSISRAWESSWISEPLLQEVTPVAKVVG